MARGHQPIVITTDANDKSSRLPAGETIIEGVKVFRHRNISNWLAYHHKIFLDPSAALKLWQARSAADVIHMHDFRTLQNVIAFFTSNTQVPYVMQAHGVVPRSGRLSSLKGAFDRLIGRRMAQNASKLIALNGREAEAYERLGVRRERIAIIPNGIDMNKYQSLPKRGTFREKYGLRQAQIVLFLGRIHESKGLDLLLEAFAHCSRKLPDARLIIAGFDDGYMDRLNTLTESLGLGQRIVIPGFLSGMDKLEAYVDADVFVTPRFSGFPLTFLEAMACGLPILTSDAGDYIEGIDNQVGFVTQPLVDEYGNTLTRLLTDIELRKRFSERAKEFAREHDWDLIVRMIEDVYGEISGAPL